MKKIRSKTAFAAIGIMFFLVAAITLSAAQCMPFGKKAPQSAAVKARDAAPVIHDKWAVIVGVGDYKDPAFHKLRFSERAAEGLTTALVDDAAGKFAPDHVITLTRSHATKSAIIAALSESWLLSKALPNDLIVVYFCSRAVPSSDGKALVVCTYDTASDSLENSGLVLHDLLAQLRRRSQCKNIVCLLDLQPASGTLSPPTNLLFPSAQGQAAGNVSALTRLAQVSNVSLVSGNALLAPSFESPSKHNTYFSYYLAEGMRQNGGLQTLGDLTQYVGQNAVNDARNELSQEQLVEMRLAPDSPSLNYLALGVPKVQVPVSTQSNVRIGYPYERLGIDHPDLLPGAPAPVKTVPTVHGALAGSGLTQQAAASAAAHPVRSDDQNDNDDQDFDQPKADMGPYLRYMKAYVQSKWIPPKGLEQKKVTVVFTILKDGTITEAEVIEASGEPLVDQSALNALTTASPLRPLPMGAPKSIRVNYKFQWKVSNH
jgi:TonB family protein